MRPRTVRRISVWKTGLRLWNGSLIARNQNFARLFLGESASYFGTAVSTVVIPLIAVLSVHATVFQMGVLGALQFAPYFFLGPASGVVADRYSRRRIGIIANGGRSLLLASLIALAVAGWLSLFALYSVTLIASSLAVFFDAAFWPLIHDVVGGDDLVDANSKLLSTQSASTVMGPGIGGVLVGILTAPIALVSNVLTYLFSAFQFARITLKEPPRAALKRDLGIREQLRSGIHLVLNNRILLLLQGASTTYNVSYQIIITGFFIFTARELGLSAFEVGAVFSAGGIGALGGSLLVPRLSRRMGIGKVLIAGMFLGNSAWLLLCLTRGHSALVSPIMFVMLLLDGIGNGLTNALFITIRQLTTPKEILASSMASSRTISYGMVPLGALLGGLLGSAIGVWPTLVVGAFGAFVSSFWVLFPPIPQIKQMTSGHGTERF